MRTIHFYTAKWYLDKSFKLLCTKKRTLLTELDAKPVTSMHNVTCPDCLTVLIPKVQANLDRMLKVWETGKQVKREQIEDQRQKEAFNER